MKFVCLPFCFVGLALSTLHAQQQDAPAVNVDTILRDLDNIEQQQKQTIVSARQAAMNRLKSAASSGSAATSLYSDAVEAVSFEGKANKVSAVSDWKSANSDLLKSKEMQTILQMHLKYLVLSLDRGASDQPEQFVGPALAYANELLAVDSLFIKQEKKAERPSDKDQALNNQINEARKDLLDKSVADGVFAKWLRLGQWLPKADSWELAPGNLAGILEKDVRGQLREKKDPKLIDTWDMEMRLLADRATSGRLEFAATDFNTVTRPKLMFARANDMIIVGQKNRGVNEIYMLVKTYPQHPEFSKWVDRLRELLKKPEPAAAAAPATTAPSTSP